MEIGDLFNISNYNRGSSAVSPNSCVRCRFGHISKLVPLGGNFRNAFTNPILDILECLNLLL